MGALIPLVLSIAPEIADWLFGPSAGAATESVTKVVGAVTGTTDPEAAAAALADKPELATQLKVQLAQIAAQDRQATRAAELDTLKASLSDVADARGQTEKLVQMGSGLAWSPVLLSGIVLMAFSLMIYVVLTRSLPEGSGPLANVLLGTLAAMASQVGNYWLGSSAASANKDSQISQMAAIAHSTVPASVAHQLLPARGADALNAAELARTRSH
jgi:hypothetical protein